MDEKTNGYILRSKTDWYEKGERSSKFFSSLEKKKAVNNTMRSLTEDENEPENITKCDKKIRNGIKNFYTNLFKRKSIKTFESCKEFLQQQPLSHLFDAENEI